VVFDLNKFIAVVVLFSQLLTLRLLGLKEGKQCRERAAFLPLPRIQNFFCIAAEVDKILPAGQDEKSQPRIADSSSTKAVNFSSARTTKRFPSLRCASAIQIVRPQESTAETQPQLQPALLRLSAIIRDLVR
jgi:hypothetical protein